MTLFSHGNKIVSAIKRVGFVRVRISCIVLRGRWLNIVLNKHARREEKSDDSKDTCYEELGQVFYNFPKHHIKIPLGDLNAKVG